MSNILVNQLLLMMLLMCSFPNRFKLLLVIQERSALQSFTTKHQVRLETYTLSCLNCKQNPVQLATCTLKNILLNYCLMINIVSFVIDLIIVLAPGDVAEHTGVDTGSLYGGVFAGIIILAFAIIIIALIIR